MFRLLKTIHSFRPTYIRNRRRSTRWLNSISDPKSPTIKPSVIGGITATLVGFIATFTLYRPVIKPYFTSVHFNSTGINDLIQSIRDNKHLCTRKMLTDIGQFYYYYPKLPAWIQNRIRPLDINQYDLIVEAMTAANTPAIVHIIDIYGNPNWTDSRILKAYNQIITEKPGTHFNVINFLWKYARVYPSDPSAMFGSKAIWRLFSTPNRGPNLEYYPEFGSEPNTDRQFLYLALILYKICYRDNDFDDTTCATICLELKSFLSGISKDRLTPLFQDIFKNNQCQKDENTVIILNTLIGAGATVSGIDLSDSKTSAQILEFVLSKSPKDKTELTKDLISVLFDLKVDERLGYNKLYEEKKPAVLSLIKSWGIDTNQTTTRNGLTLEEYVQKMTAYRDD